MRYYKGIETTEALPGKEKQKIRMEVKYARNKENQKKSKHSTK